MLSKLLGSWERMLVPRSLCIVGIGLALGILGSAPAAFAVPSVFFGEDLGLGESTPLSAFPNASAARNSFLSGLVGVGTESFEGFASGTGAPLALSFPGAGTATLQGDGAVDVVPSGSTNSVGRYATDGTHYFETNSDTFSVDFSSPVAAFGFFGIDIGDFDGQVTLTTAGGLNQTFNIDNTIGAPGGSILFWGLIDPDNTFTSATFGNTSAGVDFFGFDQMTIGSRQQVAIPEPGTWLLLFIAGLFCLAARRKMRTE
ncbi:MAG: PEP-CTERM sorting domain-containing protein [Nitrospira sp.]|nr:PEP-CTERM sorting domain-containing protein [Nitrospira sp.]